MACAAPGRDAAMLGSARTSVCLHTHAAREQDHTEHLADHAPTPAFPQRLFS